MPRALSLFLAILSVAVNLSQHVAAEPVQPGEPVRYQPMYPDRWKQKGTSLDLFPWEGKHVIVLTTKKDLDPEVMQIFLDRLDAGWELYGKLVKSPPIRFGLIRGKATIAMVPDLSYTCGLGCGNVANTGVEIGGFYRNYDGGAGDYDRVKRNHKVFQHYYFYELGRNWNSPGRRHSHFGTGYSVFMRYVCLDTLGYEDEDKRTRQEIERGEEVFSRSTDTFMEMYFTRDSKKPRPLDLNAMYASMMLKLHRENGGNEWLKRYFDFLFECPEFNAPKPQMLNWVVSASCAAKKDLTPLFVDRWRFPITRAMREVLAKVDWTADKLSPLQILQSLPPEEFPTELAALNPKFVTDELRKGNLLGDSSFERTKDFLWKPQANKGNGAAIRGDAAAHDEKRSIVLENTRPEDTRLLQTVTVKPKTWYLLCGWIRTQGVQIHEKEGLSGAILNVNGTWDRTMTLTGDHDWTYVSTVVNSGDRTSLDICVRLGFTSSVATGKAWFDDILFVEVPQKK